MASERAGKKWYLVEALGFAALVGMYIWKWQEASPQTWWVLAAWLVVSAVLRHDTPKTLGWRADNLWVATKRAVPFFAIASVAVCGAGLFLGMLQRLPAHLIEPRRFTGYFAFCVLQQVALNSYLTNRLLGCLEKAWRAEWRCLGCSRGRGIFCRWRWGRRFWGRWCGGRFRWRGIIR